MEDGGGCKDNLSCSIAVEKAAEFARGLLADGKIKKKESQQSK
jgi:hypothetical protein